MKRLRRWLFNLLAGASLLLFLVIAAMCVRGYIVRDYLSYTFRTEFQPPTEPGQRAAPARADVYTTITFFSESGMIGVDELRYQRSLWSTPFYSPMQTPMQHELGMALDHSGWYGNGFTVTATSLQAATLFVGSRPHNMADVSTKLRDGDKMVSLTAHTSNWTYAISCWIPLLLSVIVPGLWMKSWRRQRLRLRLGLCLVCGYDLRATPDRCPECGSIPEERMKAEG